jgi:hypothetical protein
VRRSRARWSRRPAAANSRIIVLVSWFGTQTLNTVSDGSAYTQDKLVPNGSERFAIWSRAAPAGLASGSTLTLTWSASPSGAVLIARDVVHRRLGR